MDKIDSLISAYEKKVSLLKDIRALIASDPALAEEITSALAPQGQNPRTRMLLGTAKPTQFQRMKDVMKDGQWHTLEDIANTLGAAKGSIAPYFYRNKEMFESRKVPGAARKLEWRLKDGNQEIKDESSMGAR